MELHMHSHHWEARMPDWPAAAVSGFVAGAALMLMEFFWSIIVLNISPWSSSYPIAAIALGPDILLSNVFSLTIVIVALLTHYLLGILFGMILATIIAPFHLDSSLPMALLIGVVFGAMLYLGNFYGMVRFFPWFADMRNLLTLCAHILFGMTAAGMYLQLEKRKRD